MDIVEFAEKEAGLELSARDKELLKAGLLFSKPGGLFDKMDKAGFSGCNVTRDIVRETCRIITSFQTSSSMEIKGEG